MTRMGVVLAALFPFLFAQFVVAGHACEVHDHHGPVDGEPCVVCALAPSKAKDDVDDKPLARVDKAFFDVVGPTTSLDNRGFYDRPRKLWRSDRPPLRGPPLN